MNQQKFPVNLSRASTHTDLVSLLDAYISQAATLVENLKSEQAEAWAASETGTIAKGRDLGLEARLGESLQDFQCRIRAAIAINSALTGARAVQTPVSTPQPDQEQREPDESRADAIALEHKWKVGFPSLVQSFGATMAQSRSPFLCVLGSYLQARRYQVCADLIEHLVLIGYGVDLDVTIGEIVDHGI